MKQESRYLRWLTGGILGLMSMAAGLNWFVNPFSVFDAPVISDFNANKPDYVNYLRLTHAYRIERLKPECILLGTSRTGRGLSPDHPALKDLKCYNMALPAMSLYEMRRYLQHAQAIRPQKLVILALDLRIFNPEPGANAAFSDARLRVDSNGQRQFNLFSAQLPDLASSLISMSALQASVTAVRKQSWVKDTLAPDGFWEPLTDQWDHIKTFPFYTRTGAQQFEEMLKNEDIFRKNVEELRLLLRETYGRGTDVKLIIHPAHAWHWQTLWLSGLWPRFEAMKRQLMGINAEEAIRANHKAYPVWDFSGTYGPALESIPTKQGDAMRWVWEPGHYKQALGDVLLNRVMGIDMEDPELAGFGVKLDEAGLESHLAHLRTLQEQYAVNYPDDVARIRTLMKEGTGSLILGQNNGK